MSDAIVKEIRDSASITPSPTTAQAACHRRVGEMGGRVRWLPTVELDKVPLKYPGMAAVGNLDFGIAGTHDPRGAAEEKFEKTHRLPCQTRRRGPWDIGNYTDMMAARTSHGTMKPSWICRWISCMTAFPETPLKTTFTRGGSGRTNLPEPDYGAIVCSKTMLWPPQYLLQGIRRRTQYDHNVQGTAVLGPLQGKGRVGCRILRSPSGSDLAARRGALSGSRPRYSDIDTYHMADRRARHGRA
jgi:hypothetical protein